MKASGNVMRRQMHLCMLEENENVNTLVKLLERIHEINIPPQKCSNASGRRITTSLKNARRQRVMGF